jgi:hypothetical protein
MEKGYDPIGPGTPAWNQFEKALHRYRIAKRHNAYDPDYKAYCNHRQSMVNHVTRHDRKRVKDWTSFLLKAANDPTYPDPYDD